MAFENNVQATLQSNVAIGATTVDVVKAVAPNKDVPASGRLTLSATGKTEIISYTGRTDNTTYWTLTGVTKNAESSFGDQAWSAGDACFQALTAADVASLSTIHSATAPTNPTVGTKWFNTTTGVLQEYLTDGTDFAWLDISAGAVAGASGSSTLSGLSDTTVATTDPLITSNPSAVGHVWVNSTTGMTYVCTDITVDMNIWFNVGLGSLSVLPPFTATGGTITTVGNYKIHTFLTSGTFTPNKAGIVDYLVVAGGGSGGAGGWGAGGGGAGGLQTATGFAISNNNPITVTVGAGGAAAVASEGVSGSNSVFSTITSIGGGGGAISSDPDGLIGGSGGGGTYNGGNGGSGTSGQGNAGGSNVATYGVGAGGGGASGAGSNSGILKQAGAGGDGSTSILSGSSVTYAGGGGGGTEAQADRTIALGGSGGGGNGGKQNGTVATAGTDNTGSGGGGTGSSAGTLPSGSGGSGIVIVRYVV